MLTAWTPSLKKKCQSISNKCENNKFSQIQNTNRVAQGEAAEGNIIVDVLVKLEHFNNGDRISKWQNIID